MSYERRGAIGKDDYPGSVNMVPLKWLYRLVLCVGMLLSMPVNASSILVVDETPIQIDLTPYLQVLEDPEAQYGEEDLTDTIFNASFEPLYRGSANYGFSDSDWWVRFTVKNDSDSAEKAVVKLDYPLLDFVDVWVLNGAERIDFWKTGNRRPFSTRGMEHRDFLFPVNLAPHEQRTVYVRIRTEGPVNIGVKLIGDHTLLPNVELEYMAFGGYLGGLLLLALCVALLYVIGRDTAFLYYLAYIVSYGCYMMAFNGLAFQYFWPETPEFGQISRPVLLTLATIFLLQFSRALLGISKVSPLLHRSVSGVQVILVVILLMVPFFGYGPFVEALATLDLVALFLVIAMGVVAHNNGQRAARYYLAAWSVFLVGLLLYLLKVFGLLPHVFITHYGFQVGSLFEFIFLSMALGVRIRELKHQTQTSLLSDL